MPDIARNQKSRDTEWLEFSSNFRRLSKAAMNLSLTAMQDHGTLIQVTENTALVSEFRTQTQIRFELKKTPVRQALYNL